MMEIFFLKRQWNLEEIYRLKKIGFKPLAGELPCFGAVCYSLREKAQSSKTTEGDCHGFPTLCPAIFNICYWVLHEENLAILSKLVKEVVYLEKRRPCVQPDTVEELLIKLQESVNVPVSLVNMCRTHDKMGEEEAEGGPVIPESVLKKQKRNEEWTLAKKQEVEVKKKNAENWKLIYSRAKQYAKEYEEQIFHAAKGADSIEA